MSGPTRRPRSGSSQIPDWQPNTLYGSNTVVRAPDGTLQRALVTFTSGASFNQANWIRITGVGPSVRLTPPVAGKPGATLRPFLADFGGGAQIDPVVFLKNNLADGIANGGGSKDDQFFGNLGIGLELDYEPVIGVRQMEGYFEYFSVGNAQSGTGPGRMHQWRPIQFYGQTTTNKTSLNGAVAAGATSIVVAAATGISAAGATLDTMGGAAQGDQLLIEDADLTKREIVKVTSVAGTTIGITALQFDHSSGAVVYRLAGRAEFAKSMLVAVPKAGGIVISEYGDALDGTLDVQTYLIKRGLLQIYGFTDLDTVLNIKAGAGHIAQLQMGYGGTDAVINLLTENATTARLKIGGVSNSVRWAVNGTGLAMSINTNLADAVASFTMAGLAANQYGLRVRGVASHAAHLVRFEPQGTTTPTSGVDQNGAVFQYVKNTAGAPASGTWELGSTVVNTSDSKIYVCTVAGTPGTWKSVAIA